MPEPDDPLARADLFSELQPELRMEIARRGRSKRLAAGEVLFREGDAGDALYAVRRGALRVSTTDRSGRTLVLNTLGPGDVLGEIALLDGEPRTADVTAEEPSEVWRLSRSTLLGLLKRDTDAALAVIGVLCRRLRWVNARLEDAQRRPLVQRLARRLCQLVDDYGDEILGSQESLAEFVGASRERVNRELRRWQAEGLVKLGRGRITVLDADALAEVARGAE